MEFLESIRKGAARAQLETEKRLRINRVQREIDALNQQIRQRTLQLGEKALELYQAGELPEPDLVAICKGIVILKKEIAEKEAQIEAIRLESLPEEMVAVPATYGHLCPQCRISLPEEAGFCPHCGSRAIDVPPPSVPSMAAKCTNCGAMIPEDAAFCPQCGMKVERKPEAVEPLGAVCSECGSPLEEDAVFCPDCGTKVPEAQAPKPKDVSIPEEKGSTTSEE
ncbi:MAG: zinc-ribbon domain-containing protein [Dehalococcoidia bacterium]|nr:zinc-ribbon domain-containing protein [Dehalococcoidia bacterium]